MTIFLKCNALYAMYIVFFLLLFVKNKKNSENSESIWDKFPYNTATIFKACKVIYAVYIVFILLVYVKKKGEIYIGNFVFREGLFTHIPGARRGIWNYLRAGRRTLRMLRRPEWCAKWPTETGTEARGQGVQPKIIFKIPEHAMGFWGKSTAINQNFVHIFFLILLSSKRLLYLYMNEYTLLKKYLDSLCLAGVFILKLTVNKTLIFGEFYKL